jgi:CheY-like chemotaxis protein
MGSGRGVLVIDDDPFVRRLVKVALQDSDLEVSTAANGVEALDWMERGEPDAIVLDLEMPVMDGRAFYHEMRQRGYDAPVLILSAYDAREGYRELRAGAFMAKPFDPDALLTAVVELMESAGT